MDNTIVAATVGAVVATGVTILVGQVQKKLNDQAVTAEVNHAYASGRETGYHEGYTAATVQQQEVPARKLSAVS